MKKILAVSAVTAAVIFTGCWDSDNGTSAPDFATKSAVLNDVNDSAKALTAVEATDDFVVAKATKTVALYKNLNANNALNILNSHVKLPANIQSKFEQFNQTLAEEDGCEYRKRVREEACPDGGKITITEEVKPDSNNENICNFRFTVAASKCQYSDDGKSVYVNGLFEDYGKAYVGDERYTDLEIGFLMNFVETNKYLDENNKTVAQEDWKANWRFGVKAGYKSEQNGSITLNNKITAYEKGSLTYKAVKEKNVTADVAVKANFNETLEVKGENKFALTMNGWFEGNGKYLEQNGSYSQKRFGIATKNFEIEMEENNSIEYSVIGGKIGTTCTNGLVAFKTLKTMEENLSANDEFPYTGKIEIDGANNSKATVEFYKDDQNKTHAIVSVEGDGNKTYNSWTEIYKDANVTSCMQEIVIPDPDFFFGF